MAGELIAVVDDEADIRELIEFNLLREGYRVAAAATGEEALAMAKASPPDLIVLDLMLPGIGGLEVCRELSAFDIPILMLTAKCDDADIVLGLEMGADDYLTKPFRPRVLIARIRAILRRKSKMSADLPGRAEPEISHCGIIVDTARRLVKIDGVKVDFSVTEFGILEHLIRNPGWVLSRGQIIAACKGDNYPATDRSVDVQILSIRKKLGSKSSLIETVRGIGYRMAE